MTIPDQQKLAAAVSGIWEKFRGTTLERVSVLEEAAVALLGDDLGPDERRHAEREAHKLAGSVGTFGFSRGSELAREIELLLSGSHPIRQAEILRLSELTVSLRHELERPTAGGANAAVEKRAAMLIVDEDREFTERVAMEAEGRGLTVRVAERMSDVMAALATQFPDVVILDPFFCGDTEVGLRLLTEMTTRAPSRPVVIASLSSAFADRVDAARLGARAYLQKPVSPGNLVEAALQTLRRGDVAGTILAVDDDPQLLAAIQAMLEPAGLRVSTLEDPRAFWDTLEQVRPDLIMLDVDMPHVNGIELCRVVRNDNRWSMIPVIFLTSRTDAATVHEIFDAGADDYVSKPIVGPELAMRIENRLERVRLYQQLADTDGLTGVANRRKSEESIIQLMTLAGRQQKSVALAVIDLDHFKRINDRFGHAIGDDVLRRVSKRLRHALRGEDVIGRWGGEEFVIAAYGAQKQALSRRLNEVLNALRSDGVPAGGESLPLTFSAGIAEYPLDGVDLASVYRAADAALYEAKARGREKIVATGWTHGEADDPQDADVVLVEDDPVLAELLLHAFTTHGYRTRWVRDGEAAVESLAGPAPSIRARVVLLDVNLPGRDGLTVLQELARSGVTKTARVIMLTVRSTEGEVVRSLEMGAFDHVAKPFSVPVLLRRIHTALELGVIDQIVLRHAVVVLSVVVTAVLLFLTGHGVWLAVARRSMRQRLARGNAALTRLVTSGELDRAEIDVVRALPAHAQERLISDLARNFGGTFRESLRDVAVDVGAFQRAIARTRSRFWWRRVQGVRTLAALGAAEPLVLDLLRDPHPGVRAQVAEWAADNPSPAILRALLMMLASSETLYRFVVQDALLRAGPAAAEPLAEFLGGYRGTGTRPALEVAAIIAHSSFAEPAIALCRDEDPRIRAGAAEVLGAVGGEAGVGVLVELLCDTDAEVRCAAANAIARLRHWPAAPAVAPLLRDRVFKVRRAAGLALSALGSPGQLLLRRFQKDSDRFAADMARQVLDLPAVGEEAAR